MELIVPFPPTKLSFVEATDFVLFIYIRIWLSATFDSIMAIKRKFFMRLYIFIFDQLEAFMPQLSRHCSVDRTYPFRPWSLNASTKTTTTATTTTTTTNNFLRKCHFFIRHRRLAPFNIQRWAYNHNFFMLHLLLLLLLLRSWTLLRLCFLSQQIFYQLILFSVCDTSDDEALPHQSQRGKTFW